MWPTGQHQPTVSSLNWSPGETVANLVTVPVGVDGKVDVFNQAGTVEVIADVVGFHTGAGGAYYQPVSPTRVVDSRWGAQIGGVSTPWAFGECRDLAVTGTIGRPTQRVTVPGDAHTVTVNVTAVGPRSGGYATVFGAGQPRPATSTLNVTSGDVRANAAVVAVGAAGHITLCNVAGAADYLIDVVGFSSRAGS